jgi:hypothetical protein
MRLQIEKTIEEFNRKTLGLVFLNRANGTSSDLLKIRILAEEDYDAICWVAVAKRSRA